MAVAFIGIIGVIMFVTRKKPGRRYDNKEPGRAEAQIDNWHGTG